MAIWANGAAAPSISLTTKVALLTEPVTYTTVEELLSLGGGLGGGSVWRNGAEVPSNAVGADGDYYLRTINGDIYQRQDGSYVAVANIRGPGGQPGAGVPNGGTTGQVLKKASELDQATYWAEENGGGGGVNRNVVTTVASAGGVTQLNAALGDYFVTTLTESTQIQVINPPDAGSLTVRIMQGANSYAVALPPGFHTQGDTAFSVSTAAGARDRIVITSDDGFTTADVDIGKDYR